MGLLLFNNCTIFFSLVSVGFDSSSFETMKQSKELRRKRQNCLSRLEMCWWWLLLLLLVRMSFIEKGVVDSFNDVSVKSIFFLNFNVFLIFEFSNNFFFVYLKHFLILFLYCTIYFSQLMIPLNYFTQQLVISVKPRVQSAPFFLRSVLFIERSTTLWKSVSEKSQKKINRGRKKEKKDCSKKKNLLHWTKKWGNKKAFSLAASSFSPSIFSSF